MTATAYLFFALWFWIVDMLAGEVAASKPRPGYAAVLALAWPLSVAAALVCSAVLVRRWREGVKP